MIDAARSYSALSNLMKSSGFNGKTALSLIKTRDAIKQTAEAYDSREILIVQRYGDKDDSGNPIIQNGTVKVSNPEKERLAKIELLELKNECVEIDISEKPFLDLESITEPISISVEELDLLRGVLRFERDG